MNAAVRRWAWRRLRRPHRAATRSYRWTARSCSWPWRPLSESETTRGRRRSPSFRRETGQRQTLRGCKSDNWWWLSECDANTNPQSLVQPTHSAYTQACQRSVLHRLHLQLTVAHGPPSSTLRQTWLKHTHIYAMKTKLAYTFPLRFLIKTCSFGTSQTPVEREFQN